MAARRTRRSGAGREALVRRPTRSRSMRKASRKGGGRGRRKNRTATKPQDDPLFGRGGDASFLRSRQADIALGAEHVAVEIGDPLPPARGDVEIADRGLYVRRDAVPEELRIEIDEVGRRGIAELAVQAGFLEFVIQRIRLADVMGIAELADQVGGAQQGGFLVAFLVLARQGGGKAGAFDGAG